jgi:hypothetical protein
LGDSTCGRFYMITIYTHQNKFKQAKHRLVCRSTTGGVVSQDAFVNEVAEHNTTITRADTLAVFDVINELLLKYVQNGDRVYLPFGSFYANACGTMDSDSDAFTPGAAASDHDISFIFAPSTESKEKIRKTEWERGTDEIRSKPVIIYLKDVQDNFITSIPHNDTLLIKGKKLAFYKETDGNDVGVFLVQGDKTTECTYFQYVHDKCISLRINADVPVGKYFVHVKTKYGEAATDTELEVTA